ncbi:MAG: DUF4169 family protein [Rhodobacteraceae bacterium]|nr:DUF4169 family protein [Paracoccaceae bacterium]
MTADVVNLRGARKERERRKKRSAADANAAKFGRTPEQRKLAEARADLEKNRLDAHQMGKPDRDAQDLS